LYPVTPVRVANLAGLVGICEKVNTWKGEIFPVE
jgi:hypothetical protein